MSGNASRRGEEESEEQALLRRCKPFVFSDPNSIGGGVYKDVLYLTPCGRWLRICSAAYYYGDPGEGEHEVAVIVNSTLARSLFEWYDWPVPAELEQPVPERDIEVTDGLADALADFLADSKPTAAPSRDSKGGPDAEEEPTSLADSAKTKRSARKAPKSQRRSTQRAGNRRDTVVVPPDAKTIATTEIGWANIPRNAVLEKLRAWAVAWPSVSPPRTIEAQVAALTVCEKHLLLTFAQTPYRLTREKLKDRMAELRFEDGGSTIGNAATKLAAEGRLDKDRKAKPPGYGLSKEGRDLAEYLSEIG